MQRRPTAHSRFALRVIPLLISTYFSTGFYIAYADTPTAAPTAVNTTTAESSHTKTYEETLPNGLKVIIREDHRTPVVMTQVWYKVGSSDENSDETGLSHALEHMMFKGTTKVPNDEYTRLNTHFGGETNAFTTANYTGYYQLYPATRLGLALEMEADRMQNLKLKESDFTPEMQVITEERRMRTDDNPQALAYERFRMMAYPTSPLRYPTIGYMKSIQKLKLDALKRWYQTWYTPNNAVLVIVGDVTPTDAMKQVKQYFGDIPQRPVPHRPDVDEFMHTGERSMTIHAAVQVPSVSLAWNVPSLTTADKPEDAYALSLASEILDGGLSARLETHLVRKQQILAGVTSNYDLFGRGGSLFTVTAVPAQGHTLAEARTAVLQEIEKLKTDPITADEMARVKINQRAEIIFNQDSIAGQAQLIGELEVANLSYQLVDELPQKLNALSVQTVQAAAKRFLTIDSLSTLYLESLTPTTVQSATQPHAKVSPKPALKFKSKKTDKQSKMESSK
jgi:zinc protease